MAVNSIADLSKLVISSEVGVDPNGNPLLKSKTYNYVKANALDSDIFEVAQAIASLQVNPVYSVERIDREELTQI